MILTKEQREEIQEDIAYVNWFSEKSGTQAFTTQEVKQYVVSQNRLIESTQLLLSSEQALSQRLDQAINTLNTVKQELMWGDPENAIERVNTKIDLFISSLSQDSCIDCGKPFEPDQYVVHCNECGNKKFLQILEQSHDNRD